MDVLTDESLAHLVIDMESSLANLKKEVFSIARVMMRNNDYQAIQMLFIIRL